MIKKKDVSQEDKKIWEEYTKNPADVFDKDIINVSDAQYKSRFKFDLHGYTLENANEKVSEIIFLCIEKKYKEILLITGKGLHSKNDKDIFVSRDLSKLKYSVPEFIKSSKEISKLIKSIEEAESHDGGDGALLIKLKSQNKLR